MYLERSKKIIAAKKKQYKQALSDVYLQIEALEKIEKVRVKYGLSVSVYGFVSISYQLKKDDRLSYIANQIFEEIDELLHLDGLRFELREEFNCIELNGTYKEERIELSIYYSQSDNCTVEYEDVTVKKAKLICD